MNYLEGNILDVKLGIICHQVNCRRKMGAGLALQIKNKYPYVYTEYIEGEQILGTTKVVSVAPQNLEYKDIFIANIFGQDDYNSSKRQTNYEALYIALEQLLNWRSNNLYQGEMLPIYFPKGMSSALAGGNWNIVQCMIEQFFPDARIVEFKQ